MEEITTFNYCDLKEKRNLNMLSEFTLSLSPTHASVLQTVEKRAIEYQLSSALAPYSSRTLFKALRLFLPELWACIRYQNLNAARGIFIEGKVQSVIYEETDNNDILVHMKLKKQNA